MNFQKELFCSKPLYNLYYNLSYKTYQKPSMCATIFVDDLFVRKRDKARIWMSVKLLHSIHLVFANMIMYPIIAQNSRGFPFAFAGMLISSPFSTIYCLILLPHSIWNNFSLSGTPLIPHTLRSTDTLSFKTPSARCTTFYSK